MILIRSKQRNTLSVVSTYKVSAASELTELKRVSTLYRLQGSLVAHLDNCTAKSCIFQKNRQPPVFPRRLQRSTFGRFRLNHRVRDVYGCFPGTCPHRQRQWGLLGLHCLTYLYNGYASSTGCLVQPLNGPRPYFVSLAGLSEPLPGSLLALPLERR